MGMPVAFFVAVLLIKVTIWRSVVREVVVALVLVRAKKIFMCNGKASTREKLTRRC